MKKYIIQVAKAKIEDLGHKYALNFIAKVQQSLLDTPEAKKQVEAAEYNMGEALKQIEWYEKFLKEQTPKKK